MTGAVQSGAIASAHAFRVVLDALSRPGQVRRVETAPAPPGISPAAAVLLRTISDMQTPVWLASADSGPVADWLAFQTGAPVTSSRSGAVLAVGSWEALAPLADWPQGTPDYPDRSATLIVEVPSLTAGAELILTGPGVDSQQRFSPALPAGAGAALAANAAQFPLGLDFFFTAGDELAGLPRSTRIGG